MSVASKSHCASCGARLGEGSNCPLPWCPSQRLPFVRPQRPYDAEKLAIARDALKRISYGVKAHAIWLDAKYMSPGQLDEILEILGEEE